MIIDHNQSSAYLYERKANVDQEIALQKALGGHMLRSVAVAYENGDRLAADLAMRIYDETKFKIEVLTQKGPRLEAAQRFRNLCESALLIDRGGLRVNQNCATGTETRTLDLTTANNDLSVELRESSAYRGGLGLRIVNNIGDQVEYDGFGKYGPRGGLDALLRIRHPRNESGLAFRVRTEVEARTGANVASYSEISVLKELVLGKSLTDCLPDSEGLVPEQLIFGDTSSA